RRRQTISKRDWSSDVCSSDLNAVKGEYGDDYLFRRVRNYGGGSSAQDAHEAIRPAGSYFKKPGETGLYGAQFKLYDLIWKRTVRSEERRVGKEWKCLESMEQS